MVEGCRVVDMVEGCRSVLGERWCCKWLSQCGCGALFGTLFGTLQLANSTHNVITIVVIQLKTSLIAH